VASFPSAILFGRCGRGRAADESLFVIEHVTMAVVSIQRLGFTRIGGLHLQDEQGFAARRTGRAPQPENRGERSSA
jgi:hypothetical protein